MGGLSGQAGRIAIVLSPRRARRRGVARGPARAAPVSLPRRIPQKRNGPWLSPAHPPPSTAQAGGNSLSEDSKRSCGRDLRPGRQRAQPYAPGPQITPIQVSLGKGGPGGRPLSFSKERGLPPLSFPPACEPLGEVDDHAAAAAGEEDVVDELEGGLEEVEVGGVGMGLALAEGVAQAEGPPEAGG